MTAPECNRMRRFAWLALLLTACGTEPETEPILDFEFALEEIDDRTGALYYRMTPTHDGSPVDWTDVLRTGWCFEIHWLSYWLASETEGQPVMSSRYCGSPIQSSRDAVARVLSDALGDRPGGELDRDTGTGEGRRQPRHLARVLVPRGPGVSGVSGVADRRRAVA